MTKPTTLEAAIKRLEEIVAQLGGEISVDDSIRLYGEAVKLVEFADKKLEAAKLKVEKLNGEGSADEPV